MSDVPIRDAQRSVSGPGAAGAPARTADKPRFEADGALFRALLERLETRARELSGAREASDAEELAGAVESARHALEDALSLGDRLLEAYRAATVRGEGSEAPAREGAA